MKGLFGIRIVKPRKVALIFEEVHLERFFKHYEVDCVFDVGANNGQYATLLRRRVGYKGSIVSFEPIPAAAALVREKASSDSNWYVEEAALDATSGHATFNVMQGKQFSSLHTPSEKEVD